MTPPHPGLAPDELHVWQVSLDPPPEVAPGLESLLADDEHARADDFRFERDRRRFVVGRGILRTLLGRYVGAPAQELKFRYGTFGKPVLDGGGPWFNLAHSGSVALFAFSASVEVGIDVERSPAPPDADLISERFFSPAEAAELRALPVSERASAFLACWTRKEAFVKARGDGLSLPLDAFDVGFAPGQPCRLLRTGWSAEEPGRWRLVDLSDPAEGYVAALAARDVGWRVLTRHLDTTPVDDCMTLQETT